MSWTFLLIRSNIERNIYKMNFRSQHGWEDYQRKYEVRKPRCVTFHMSQVGYSRISNQGLVIYFASRDCRLTPQCLPERKVAHYFTLLIPSHSFLFWSLPFCRPFSFWLVLSCSILIQGTLTLLSIVKKKALFCPNDFSIEVFLLYYFGKQ